MDEGVVMSISFTVVAIELPDAWPKGRHVTVFETRDPHGRTVSIVRLLASWFHRCTLEIVCDGEVLAQTTSIELCGDYVCGGKLCQYRGLERADAFAYSPWVNSVSTCQLRAGDVVNVTGPLPHNLFELMRSELSVHNERRDICGIGPAPLTGTVAGHTSQ